jgi:putative photosynthetic complex assembly protein 2
MISVLDTTLAAVLATLFLWWASTGVILWRVRRADRKGAEAHLASTVFGLPLLALGLTLAVQTRDNVSTADVYGAFVAALAIWGWIELAFLSGIVTGPVTTPCPPGLPLGLRFWRATGTILWHELALVAGLLVLDWIVEAHANHIALWVFGVLFFARVSAKLNLFFGVPRIHTEFLPGTLSHLASYFRLAPMNAVFPLSVTGLAFASACFIERAVAAGAGAERTGFVLLATLTLLALLEHWFMVLPVPDQKLWRWAIPKPPALPDLSSGAAFPANPVLPQGK